MALYKAFDPKVEVNGETVLGFVNGLGAFKRQALALLKEQGIDDPTPGIWYSQQAWLNGFKMIGEKFGDATLKKIGESVANSAIWPKEIKTIVDALKSIDVAYHMNHRNGKIGNYAFTKIDAETGQMVCSNPYPDQFDLGLIRTVAEKFKPSQATLMVSIDESQSTRTKGAETTTFIIKGLK